MTDRKNAGERSASCSGSAAANLANAVEVYRVESADGIVDGNYVGEWCGYQVSFETPFGRYVAEMDKGIRGTAQCIVRVLHARVTAEIRKGQAAEEIERLRAELRYERARADLHDHAEELVDLRRLIAGLREIDEG